MHARCVWQATTTPRLPVTFQGPVSLALLGAIAQLDPTRQILAYVWPGTVWITIVFPVRLESIPLQKTSTASTAPPTHTRRPWVPPPHPRAFRVLTTRSRSALLPTRAPTAGANWAILDSMVASAPYAIPALTLTRPVRIHAQGERTYQCDSAVSEYLLQVPTRDILCKDWCYCIQHLSAVPIQFVHTGVCPELQHIVLLQSRLLRAW